MARVYEMQNAPAAADYVRGLTAIRSLVRDDHLRAFRVHYAAENRAASAKQIAALVDIDGGWAIVNVSSLYGKLGHALCDELGIQPELQPDFKHRWWSVWSRGWSTRGGFVWQMLPQVADAFEQLGWVQPESQFPDEVPPGLAFTEGAVRQVTVNAYERSREAVSRCKATHGTDCAVCGFSFGAMYGVVAEGYIHVHHLRPLSEVGGAYVVDPVEDLRPVCPNCHAVLHLGGRCRSIEEVRQLLAQQRRAEPGAAADPAS
ncbi:MAG: HNH endonuclease [Bacteroidales bacterium]|nr:HNH endonuclease [Bacteroidales bacterium]